MRIVFDEYDAGRADVMFVIQRVLEVEGRLTLLDQSRVIEPHPSFRLFATANTIGLGDATGLYHGTQPLNQGQMDRWNIVVTLNYLAHDREVDVVLARCPEFRHAEGRTTVSAMIALANLTRRGFADGDLSTVMSPRTVVTWAQNTTLFHDLAPGLPAYLPQPLRRGRAGARRRVLPALHGRRSRRVTCPDRFPERTYDAVGACTRALAGAADADAPLGGAGAATLSALRAFGDRLAARRRWHDAATHHRHRPATAPQSAVFDALELARLDVRGVTWLAGVAQNLLNHPGAERRRAALAGLRSPERATGSAGQAGARLDDAAEPSARRAGSPARTTTTNR